MGTPEATASAADAPLSPPARARLYFVNAWVDFLVIGGASVLLLPLLRAVNYTERTPAVISLAMALAWVVNWPHFSATSYRLYRSADNLRTYPITAFVIPVLLVVAVGASFTWPLAVAPAFVKLFLIWSPYHFSAQSLGITLLYARRAGVPFGRVERAAFAAFIFGAFFFTLAMREVGDGVRPYYGMQIPRFGLPGWVAVAAPWFIRATGVVLVVVVVRFCVRLRRMVPLIVLLPAVAHFVWFVVYQGSFTEFVPLFHSLQYLLIAWSMQLRERLGEAHATPSRRFVWTESARWGAINFVGGAALFWLLPRLGMETGAARTFAEPVIICAVQMHHFFVDGVIWKLRNPRVAAPLLSTLDDVRGPR